MVPRGLEPRTLRLLAVRSNQLSYETSEVLASQCALQQVEVLWRPRHQIILPDRQPAPTAAALPLTRQMLQARGECRRIAHHHVTLDMEGWSDLGNWTCWGLNPGPSACEADVIPLHHKPLRLPNCAKLVADE